MYALDYTTRSKLAVLLGDPEIDVRIKQVLKTYGSGLKLSHVARDKFVKLVQELNQQARARGALVSSLLAKQLAAVLQDESRSTPQKVALLSKLGEFLGMFDGQPADRVLRELGTSFDRALDLFLEKYDMVKAWLALARDEENPMLAAFTAVLRDQKAKGGEKKAVEALIHLKNIRYLDHLLDPADPKQLEYSAGAALEKLKAVVEVVNLLRRNLVSELPEGLERRLGGILSQVTGRKVKVLVLGIHDKTKAIAGKNAELTSLEDDLKALDPNDDSGNLLRGESQYGDATLALIRERVETRARQVVSENLALVKEMLGSPAYQEYRRAMADLHEIIDEIVEGLNGLARDLAPHLANPLAISRRDYELAERNGVDIATLFSRLGVPDLEAFRRLKEEGEARKRAAVARSSEIVARTSKEEELVLGGKEGVLCKVAALYEQVASPRPIGAGLLPLACQFVSLQAELFERVSDALIRLARKLVESVIPASSREKLVEEARRVLPSVVAGLEKKREQAPFGPGARQIEERLSLLEGCAGGTCLDDFPNDALVELVRSGRLSATARSLVQKLVNAKPALNRENYDSPAVQRVLGEVAVALRDLEVAGHLERLVVHVGRYSVALDPTCKLARAMAAADWGDPSSIAGISNLVDAWFEENKGRLAAWDGARVAEAEGQVAEIKRALQEMSNLVTESSGALDRVLSKLRTFPVGDD
ncbi:MAG: hypothetical protein Kow0069_03730 [Promethearchaeota archaeon]